MSELKDTDLLLVNRGGVDYKATMEDLKTYVTPVKYEVICTADPRTDEDEVKIGQTITGYLASYALQESVRVADLADPVYEWRWKRKKDDGSQDDKNWAVYSGFAERYQIKAADPYVEWIVECRYTYDGITESIESDPVTKIKKNYEVIKKVDPFIGTSSSAPLDEVNIGDYMYGYCAVYDLQEIVRVADLAGPVYEWRWKNKKKDGNQDNLSWTTYTGLAERQQLKAANPYVEWIFECRYTYNGKTEAVESDPVVVIGGSAISITAPYPGGNHGLFENNQSTIEWNNTEVPPGLTNTRTFFYAKNSKVKEYLRFDSRQKLIFTSLTPYAIPRLVTDGTDYHKYGQYPTTVVVEPAINPKDARFANSIGAHKFPDGQTIYILTGNNTWYWSDNMMEWPEAQRSLQPDGSYKGMGYGSHQYLKDEIIYVNTGDGVREILKTSDRGKSYQVAGNVGATTGGGFFYSPTFDTFFVDTGSQYCMISTDNCATFTKVYYGEAMAYNGSSNMWAENPAGLFCFGRKKILKWDNSSKSWSLYLDTTFDQMPSPDDCTYAVSNEDGVILATCPKTEGNYPYARIAADGTVTCQPLGTSIQGDFYLALTWRPAHGKSPGLWCMLGYKKTTFSEDGLNWTPARNLPTRVTGCDTDPDSGNILFTGSTTKKPDVFQLVADFDPNVQFTGGTLQAELYDGDTLVAESNVIDIP